MPALRVVLDTNVFVSALFGKGPPARLYDAFKEGRFCLVSSHTLIAELADVLLRPELGIPAVDVKTAFRILRRRALILRPRVRVTACRDPKDDRVLECAVAGGAEVLVTGDRDLLALDPFRGIRIVTPSAFLRRLAP